MERAAGTVVLLIALCLAMPAIAAFAQAAVPLLVSLLVLIGLARLAWPAPRRRRR